MKKKLPIRIALFWAAIGMSLAPAHAQGWPEIFDPLQLISLNLEMDHGDWQTIQNDETFEIEVPAMFWADGEDPILVSVRRKSADPLNARTEFTKVSLKIDINEYVGGQTWHDLKKLSLENGDDQDVVSEGFAWHLHRLASGPEGYGYAAGHGAWVTLHINDTYTGVYVSAEQRDKQFLRNRNLYINGETWLYKMSDTDQYELAVGEGDSPTFLALCYSPFQSGGEACQTPGPDTLAAELPLLIDMRGMLTLGAVNTFTGNPDALFNHGKNCFFADFLEGRTRMYFPWDLDSAISGSVGDIYPSGSAYAEILLAVPEFRSLYTQIMMDLLTGPLAEASLVTFLDAVEDLLTESLEADPNNQIDGTIAEHFDGLQSWVSNRIEQAFNLLDDPVDVAPASPMGHVAALVRPAQNPAHAGREFTIVYEIPKSGWVQIDLCDVMGRRIATPIAREAQGGTHSVSVIMRDRLVPGVYFLKMEADRIHTSGRVVILR